MALSQAACLPDGEFACDNDSECISGVCGVDNVCGIPDVNCTRDAQCSSNMCEGNGLCSVLDTSCEFGRRFGDSAPGEFAGACVNCPPGGLLSSVNNHCYVAFEDAEWPVAQNTCATTMGATGWHLADIADAAENQSLVEGLSSLDDDVWIGGSDAASEGTWLWTDGSAIEFFNWRPNAPNNQGGDENCLEFDVGTGLWDDQDCDDINIFICEFP